MLALLLLSSAVVLSSPLSARGESKQFAGNYTSNVFPPPSATAHPALFPNESQLGYVGVTQTGIEPAAAQTAASFPKKIGHYPLVVPKPYEVKPSPLASIPVGSAINISAPAPATALPANNSADPFGSIDDYWGNLTPVKSVSSEVYGLKANATPLIPESCQLEKVFVYYRHGARYPTAGSSASSPSGFALKIQNATRTGFNTTGPLDFLSSWQYNLGSEILTPYGRLQNFLLGVANRIAYGSLLNTYDRLLVLTTESGDRMVKTSLNFAAGFFGIPADDQYELEIVIEQSTAPGAPSFNTTGSPYFKCTNSNTKAGGSSAAAAYAAVAYVPAQKRLNSFITGLQFTVSDISAMLQLCAYETDALGFSKFCELFTEEDFRAFEYAFDLSFYYSEGFGSPVAAAQGLGNLQQFMSRLTQTPIPIYNSTTNSTLDSNPITFPLSQPLYFDAVHEVTLLDTITAFNLTGVADGALPLTGPSSPPNKFRASRLVPFATSFTVQVMQCAGNADKSIRFIVNDAVIPIDKSYPGCTPNANGLCALPLVIEALHNRIGEIDFEYDCFANYTVPVGMDLNGRAPRN